MKYDTNHVHATLLYLAAVDSPHAVWSLLGQPMYSVIANKWGREETDTLFLRLLAMKSDGTLDEILENAA